MPTDDDHRGARLTLPGVSAPAFRLLALILACSYGALVLTGGAVRLTGSGLGCADWPQCSASDFIAQASFHPLVEDTNRLISAIVIVLTGVVFLAALLRRPRRRDLVALSGALVGGLVAQAVLGGLVVLFKLNPYLVALHFLLTLVVVAVAVVLHHLAGEPGVSTEPTVDPTLVWLGRVLFGATCLVLTVGTVVSGAGPHAGAPGTSRIRIAFESIAQLHSDVALFLIGLTLATVFAVHQAKAPFAVQRRARLMLELMAVQGGLGYTQYFLHDSAIVIEIHLAGATCVFVAVTHFYLGLHRHVAIGAAPSLVEPARTAVPGAQVASLAGGTPAAASRVAETGLQAGGPGPGPVVRPTGTDAFGRGG